MDFSPLKAKEVKEVQALLDKQWGYTERLPYLFFISSKNNIYINHPDLKTFDYSPLRVDSLGLYFGELRHGELRLGIEGAQLIGPKAKKNVLEITDEERLQWFQGEVLHIATDRAEKDTFVIIKHSKDVLGCGKVKEKQGKLEVLNYVPKVRRIMTSDIPK